MRRRRACQTVKMALGGLEDFNIKLIALVPASRREALVALRLSCLTFMSGALAAALRWREAPERSTFVHESSLAEVGSVVERRRVCRQAVTFKHVLGLACGCNCLTLKKTAFVVG